MASLSERVSLKMFLALFVGLLVLASLSYVYVLNRFNELHIDLDKQAVVLNQTRYVLWGSWYPKQKKISFSFELESYQNPHSLDVDFLEQLILEDGKARLYSPSKWVLEHSSKHRIRGKLHFSDVVTPYKQMSLRLFDIEDFVLSWPVSQEKVATK